MHEKDEYIYALWHEVGHIHNGHFYKDTTQEELRHVRCESEINGDVSTWEKEADAFPVLR